MNKQHVGCPLHTFVLFGWPLATCTRESPPGLGYGWPLATGMRGHAGSGGRWSHACRSMRFGWPLATCMQGHASSGGRWPIACRACVTGGRWPRACRCMQVRVAVGHMHARACQVGWRLSPHARRCSAKGCHKSPRAFRVAGSHTHAGALPRAVISRLMPRASHWVARTSVHCQSAVISRRVHIGWQGATRMQVLCYELS